MGVSVGPHGSRPSDKAGPLWGPGGKGTIQQVALGLVGLVLLALAIIAFSWFLAVSVFPHLPPVPLETWICLAG